MPEVHGERLSFEPFNSLSGVLTGAPIRVFPEGTFYRGDRKLAVTKDRLQEFAVNLKAGLPRFDIPINIEHNDEIGRYGTVKALEYFETGPSGPGLYATAYELTPAGRALLEQEKFIGLSGEAMWTLKDGAKYQDPNTGTYHDNVLVGLALTNKPFFGKEVNLYSAQAESFDDDGDDDMTMKCSACSKMNTKGAMKCKYCGASMAADNHSAGPAQGATTMADEEKTPAPEKFTVSAEEFTALKAKAGEVDKLHILMAEMKHAGRVKDLTAHVKETFTSLPVKPEELAEKFAALEVASPDLFAYFDGLLATLERQAATGDLFSQIGSALPGGNAPETFSDLVDAVLSEKFNGDMGKYAEAMNLARAKNPALAAKYETQYSVRPSKTQARA